MLSKEFLTKQIPLLKPVDSGSFALSLMEDYKLKHLPVIQDGKYMFLLSEKDIFLMSDIEDPVSNTSIFAPCIGEGTPLLEVLRIMSKDKLTVLPVVDQSGMYVGAVTLYILTEKLSEMTNCAINGSLVAIETNYQDYDLSNIVHLAESNNAKILNLYTYPNEVTGKMVVLLKLDLDDASAVLRSLERFNYRILYYFQKEELMDDTLKRRLDELMYYLEM
jgi:CBS domain-containing protein